LPWEKQKREECVRGKEKTFTLSRKGGTQTVLHEIFGQKNRET